MFASQSRSKKAIALFNNLKMNNIDRRQEIIQELNAIMVTDYVYPIMSALRAIEELMIENDEEETLDYQYINDAIGAIMNIKDFCRQNRKD